MLSEEIHAYPVVDTHEHYTFAVQEDAFPRLLLDYALSDLLSAASLSCDTFEKDIFSNQISIEERAAMISRQFEKIRFTSYGKMLLEALRLIHEFPEPVTDRSPGDVGTLLIGALKKLNTYGSERWDTLLDTYTTIEVKIVDQFNTDCTDLIMKGALAVSSRDRLSFPLPSFHHLIAKHDIERLCRYTDTDIHSLSRYITVFGEYLQQAVDFGVCTVKDQCAYYRSLDFPKVSHSEAEVLFDRILSNPLALLNETEQLVLENYLFHSQLQIIDSLKLPVQLHTGHMAGIRNDVRKANAIGLVSLLEEYRTIHFDLFHGNWPYMGEYLFVGKNYPNVSLNLCWAHAIDPEYTRELIRRAVKTVPYHKLIGFGGDTFHPAFTVVYERQAKQVIASTLDELVAEGWLGRSDSREIAHAMLYDNPKRSLLIR